MRPSNFPKPMVEATEIVDVTEGIFLWHTYDPAVKAELFSTGLAASAGTVLIDPIPLTPSALKKLRSQMRVDRIVVTNINHARASADFSRMLGAPVSVHSSIAATPEFEGSIGLDGDVITEAGVTVIPLDGGPEGEIALHFENGDGSVVIGDALINFDPHGFSFLPDKYCANAKQLRRSLHKLLDFSFERMFFAHGMPIVSGARQKLENLLTQRRG